MRLFILGFVGTVGAGLILEGCQSARVKYVHQIERMMVYRLMFRRPTFLPAGPTAEPQDAAYVRTNPPGRKLDCQEPKRGLSKLNWREISSCLASIQKIQRVKYRLVRDVRPYLEPSDLEKTPVCLQRTLSKIPVPREIIFVAGQPEPSERPGSRDPNEAYVAPAAQRPEPRKGVACYSARLALDDDLEVGMSQPRGEIELVLRFPLFASPKDEATFYRLMTSWALTPFFNARTRRVASKYVPAKLCERCFADPTLLRIESLDEREPVFWP